VNKKKAYSGRGMENALVFMQRKAGQGHIKKKKEDKASKSKKEIVPVVFYYSPSFPSKEPLLMAVAADGTTGSPSLSARVTARVVREVIAEVEIVIVLILDPCAIP